MSKSTLSFQERAVIQDWHDSAKSLRSIARHLNRSVSTISY
ncbi:helix-turn-helix domain-containing protein, partial [Lactiplantibacillus paraplantarum]